MPPTWRTHRGAKGIVLEAWGEIDLLVLPHFQEALFGAISPGVPVLLDLRGVTYLELRALSALEAASTRAAEFAIIPSAMVRRIIEVLGLQGTLQLREAPPSDGEN